MAPTPRENAALVRGVLTDAVSGGDTDVARAFVAGEVVDHHPVFGGGRGRESVVAPGSRVFAAAGVDVGVERAVATEDRRTLVATRGLGLVQHPGAVPLSSNRRLTERRDHQ